MRHVTGALWWRFTPISDISNTTIGGQTGHYFKLYNITTMVAKCRIDSFRFTGTGSICHMFLLNVEFSNTCRFRVSQCHSSTVSRIRFPLFQSPQCWHGRTEYWKLPAFIPNIQNVVTNSSCWQCLFTLLFRYFISSYYSTRCWKLSLYHPLYWPNWQRSSKRNF